MNHWWLSFCSEDTVAVARSLIGMHLVKDMPDGRLIGKIVEVEAYGGFDDAGSHISRGITERTKIMLDTPGLAYVYLIYGMYHCLNVVAHTEAKAGAVLIRAVEPLDGIEIMHKRRSIEKIRDLCNGPGKLCQAFGITKYHNGHFLNNSPLYITNGESIASDMIVATPRINIDYAGEAAGWPWRFYIKGSKYISRK